MLQKLTNRANPPWSKVEDSTLKKQFKSGLTDKQISLALTHPPRSPTAIHMRRVKLGLNSKRSFSAEDDAFLTQEYAAYKPLHEIATKLNRTPGTLQQRVMLLGLHRDGRISKLVATHGPEILSKGKTYEEMLTAIGRTATVELLKRKGKSEGHVNRALSELKRKLDKLKPEDKTERDKAFLAARSAGAKLWQIAEAAGLSAESVRKACMGVGVKAVNVAKLLSNLTDADYKQAIELAQQMREKHDG